MKLDIYKNVTVYRYRHYIFVHRKDGHIEMIHPDNYELGVYDDKEGETLEDILRKGVVDYYDFNNRDLGKFPVEEHERDEILLSFSSKEIATWFPIFSVPCRKPYPGGKA